MDFAAFAAELSKKRDDTYKHLCDISDDLNERLAEGEFDQVFEISKHVTPMAIALKSANTALTYAESLPNETNSYMTWLVSMAKHLVKSPQATEEDFEYRQAIQTIISRGNKVMPSLDVTANLPETVVSWKV